MDRREERFGWVLDVGSKAKRSVWDRISGKSDDDDDDDLPGPNAGATLWPAALVGRDAPA
ncbi:MAG TPA: hypothetical protein VGH28_14540 [Polyangiaceae bacterium]|jgi:hypothetical protein